jgi:hypothetical protein
VGLLVGAATKGVLWFAWGLILALLINGLFGLNKWWVSRSDAALAVGLFNELNPLLLIGIGAFTVVGVLVGSFLGVRYGLEAVRLGRPTVRHVASRCFRGFFQLPRAEEGAAADRPRD